MGEILYGELDDDYVAVAFTFGTGSFRALARPDDGAGAMRGVGANASDPMDNF